MDSRLSWLPLPFWLFNDMAKGSSAASRRSTSRLSCPLARRSSVSPPVNLEGLVGADGTVWGLESFGFSAPYKVLDEKLGFTGQNVYEQVKKLLA